MKATFWIVFLFCVGTAFAAPAEKVAGKKLTASDIPGMNFLLKRVSTMPVCAETRERFLEFIRPSTYRFYVQGDPSFLSSEEYQELLQKYSEIFHVPPEKVVLFAVTNSELQRTMLFPEFYKLPSEYAQAASLLHESLWLLEKWMVYEKIVMVEDAAKAYFEFPEDPEAYFNFYYFVDSLYSTYCDDLMQATWDYDRKRQTADFTLRELFGDEFLSCTFSHPQTGIDSCQEMAAGFILRSSSQKLFMRAVKQRLFGGRLPKLIKLNIPKNLKTPAERWKFIDSLKSSYKINEKNHNAVLIFQRGRETFGRVEW